MVTQRQVDSLKFLVWVSQDLNDMNKRLHHFLIDQSHLFTREVAVVLDERTGFSKEEIQKIAYNFEDGWRRHGTTRLHQVLVAMGVEWKLSVHYGHYDVNGHLDNSGQFAGEPEGLASESARKEGCPMRYTFWLSKRMYGRGDGEINVVTCSKEALDRIDLKVDIHSMPGIAA